jgi:hypothetical protein
MSGQSVNYKGTQIAKRDLFSFLARKLNSIKNTWNYYKPLFHTNC